MKAVACALVTQQSRIRQSNGPTQNTQVKERGRITSLDELKYEGGYPTAETIQKLYNQLDLQRAAQAYLDFMPAKSMQAVLDAHPRHFGVSETGGTGV